MKAWATSLRVVASTLFLLYPMGAFSFQEDALRDILDRKREIETTLREDLPRHAARNAGAIVPDPDLDWDVSRLEAQLRFMDEALRRLPCDTDAPTPPSQREALDALRSLISPPGQEADKLEARITGLEERKRYVEEVHGVAVRIYKLKLISSLADLLIRILPLDPVTTVLGMLDDIGNFSQPGEVGTWKGKEVYQRYLKENEVFINAAVVEKLKRMGREADGKLEVKREELKRLVSEVAMDKTTEDTRTLEGEIGNARTAVEQVRTKRMELDERDRYFTGLLKRLEAAFSSSLWITRPQGFRKGQASLTVYAVDDASGVAIGNVRVGLTPFSGVPNPPGNLSRIASVSPGTYSVALSAEGYDDANVQVQIGACHDHPLSVRLRKRELRAPAPPISPPTPGNRPPEVSLTADRTSLQAGDTLTLHARAIDPDGDELAYGWTHTGGTLVGAGESVELLTHGLDGIQEIVVTVSDGRGGVTAARLAVAIDPPRPFRANLTCGGSLELVPGEIDRSCGVMVQGFRGNTADRVEVLFPQQQDSSGSLPGQIVVFPGTTSEDPGNMFTPGTTDYHSQYEFSFHLSARSTAPRGTTPIRIVIRQKGAAEIELALSVSVLTRGQTALPGMGSAPPAVSGSGGSYCVFRYKLSSEPSRDCWHFAAASCADARYTNSRNGYILAGTAMSRSEADELITEQGRYFSNCDETSRIDAQPPAGNPAQSGICHNLVQSARHALESGALDGASEFLAQAVAQRCRENPAIAGMLADLEGGLHRAREERQSRVDALCLGVQQRIDGCDYEGASALGGELRGSFPDASCPSIDVSALPQMASDQSAARSLLQAAQSTVLEKDLEGAIALLRQSLEQAPDCMAPAIESLLADMESRAAGVPSWMGKPPPQGENGISRDNGGASDTPPWLSGGEEREPNASDRPPEWALNVPEDDGDNRARADETVDRAGRELGQIFKEEEEREKRLAEERRREEERLRERERLRAEERRRAEAERRAEEEAEREREEEERREKQKRWAENLDRVLVNLLDGLTNEPPPPSNPPRAEEPERLLEDIIVQSQTVVISVWDAQCEDGDRITVLVNGVPVIQNRTLFNRKESFEVDLPYESNTIEVYAENGGTDCPPGRTPPDETVNSGAISISNAVRGGQQNWRLRQRGGSRARIIVQP